jgi:hypothetical protein
MNIFMRTDAFDAWLKALRDPIGKARIIAASDLLKRAISETVSQSEKASLRCVFILVLATASTSVAKKASCSCFFAAAARHLRRKT